jgi:guanylate kinase
MASNINNTVIIITGISGSGKTTISQRLLHSLGSACSRVVTTTTREPRLREVNGVDYNFTSVDDFRNLIESNSLLEYKEVYGNYYGSTKDDIARSTREGTEFSLLVIDVIGALELHKLKEVRTISFFIVPSDYEAIEGRLRARQCMSEKDIIARRDTISKESSYSNEFDHVIVNREGSPEYATNYILKTLLAYSEWRCSDADQ